MISFYVVIFSDSPIGYALQNIEDAYTRQILSATCVGTSQQLHSVLRTVYFHYYHCKIGDQDKFWALTTCWKSCYNGLTTLLNGRKVAFFV